MPSKINYLLGIFLSILVLISHKPVFAINNPNLLPEEKTPVIDLAKTLSPNQKKSLEDKLNNLEIESGWKIKYFLENNKNFLEGVSFVIIEPNEGMVEKQKNKLEEFLNLGIDILWKGLDEVEENNINGIVIANEVLDALPVERITFSKGKLIRQAVSIDKKSHKLFFDKMPITRELEKSFELAKSELGITIPPEDALEGWTTEWHVDLSLIHI